MSVENPNCSVCFKFVRSAIFCNICTTWVHPKCKDFQNLQKSNPDKNWTCIQCNSEIFPLNKKSYTSFVTSKNTDLQYFFNQINSLDNTLIDLDEDCAANCKYYDTDKFKTHFQHQKVSLHFILIFLH